MPLLLQAWVPPLAWEWNIAAWSLSVEAFFYVIFPIISKQLQRKRFTSMRLAAFSLLLLIATSTCLLLTDGLKMSTETARPDNLTLFCDYCPLFHLPAFLIGITAGLEFLRRNKSIDENWTNVFLTFSFIAMVILAMSGRVSPILQSRLVLVPIFGILIFFGSKQRRAAVQVLQSSMVSSAR